jgi:transposase-like protein
MAKPYSEDLRARVVVAEQDGATIPETAERFGVSISSVVRFRRLHRETGSVSPAKFGGYKGYALAAHEDLVRQLVAEQPDITLAEIKAVLATEKVTGMGDACDISADGVAPTTSCSYLPARLVRAFSFGEHAKNRPWR